MIASLPMYQRPQLVKAHANFWSLIREQLFATGIEAAQYLSQDRDEFSVWTDPKLVLSQTCGMPYRLYLHDKVTLIGSPDFGLEDCPAGYYRSALIVRKTDSREHSTDFRDALFAYNNDISQSGYAAAYEHTAALGFWFHQRKHCGAHRESARAVATGVADIAALDAVSWRLIQNYDAFAEQLRVLEWTSATPGLPYISAAGNNRDNLFNAIATAIEQLSTEDRNQLGLRTIVNISPAAYLAVQNPPASIG